MRNQSNRSGRLGLRQEMKRLALDPVTKGLLYTRKIRFDFESHKEPLRDVKRERARKEVFENVTVSIGAALREMGWRLQM